MSVAKVKELLYEMDEADRKREPAKDRTAPMSGGKFALMRSAGVLPDIDSLVSVPDEALSPLERKMRGYGCDFITASYLLMRENDVTPDARDFVQIMMGMLRGSQKQVIITDDWITEYSGLSKDSIIRKRKALKAWQFKHNKCLIEIHEFPRDKGSKHFKPNQYKDVYSDIVTKYAIHISKTYALEAQAEVKTDLPDGHEKQLVWGDMRKEKEGVAFPKRYPSDEVRNDARMFGEQFRTDPIPARNKYNTSNQTSFVKRDLLDSIDARIIQAVAEGRDVARKRGISAFSWWTELRQKVALVLTEKTPGVPDPEEANEMV